MIMPGALEKINGGTLGDCFKGNRINKKSFEINSKLFWCGKQDLNLHELAFTRT